MTPQIRKEILQHMDTGMSFEEAYGESIQSRVKRVGTGLPPSPTIQSQGGLPERQLNILAILQQADNGLQQGELAQRTETNPSTIQNELYKMRGKSLIHTRQEGITSRWHHGKAPASAATDMRKGRK